MSQMTMKEAKLVDGLELLFVSAPGAELAKAREDQASEVRQLVRGLVDTVPAVVPVVGASLKDRVRALQQLAARRPDLKPRLATVFGTKKPDSARQIDELVNDLIRSGLLKAAKKKKT